MEDNSRICFPRLVSRNIFLLALYSIISSNNKQSEFDY